MKKLLTILLIVSLAFCAVSLTACGSKDTKEPVYTVTETEYLAIKSKISSHKNFIDGNFTVTINIGNNVYVNKFADGKFDDYIQGDHYVIVFDTSTYDATAKTANAYGYYYDEDDEKWYRTPEETENLDLYYSFIIPFTEYFPDTFEELYYNADKREYSASVTVLDGTFSFKAQFKDGNLLSYTLIADEFHMTCEFSDYGTTTVTPPTEYEEDN